MLVWMAVSVALVHAAPHWEPCKVQCDSNFKRNDIEEKPHLIEVCQRGCDFFTVALISTAQGTSPDVKNRPIETGQSLVISAKAATSMKNAFERANEEHKFKREVEPVRIISLIDRISMQVPSDDNFAEGNKSIQKSILRDQIERKILEVENKMSISTDKPDQNSGKEATQEPISQPVQDHPSKVNEPVTTTNDPKRSQLKSMRLSFPLQMAKKVVKLPLNSDNSIHIIIQRSEELNRGGDEVEVEDKIVQNSFSERLEQAKHSCRHACVSAYSERRSWYESEAEACLVGCDLQAATATLHPQTKVSHQDMPMSPLGILQRFAFNLAGHVGKLIKVSWSWVSSLRGHADGSKQKENERVFDSEGLARGAFGGMQSSTGKSIDSKHQRIEISELKSLPIINLLPLHKDGQVAPALNQELFLKHVNQILNKHHLNSPMQELTLLPKDYSSLSSRQPQLYHRSHEGSLHVGCIRPIPFFGPFLKAGLKKEEEKGEKTWNDPTHKAPLETTKEHPQQVQYDLLECISRKSGLPRWFIGSTIFVSAFVVLWLCFSLTAPAEDIRVVKTKPPVCEHLRDDEDFDDYDEDLSCTEKKKLLERSNNDVIKVRIENV